MNRYFEKISFEQFKKDVVDDKSLYEEYNLPKRGTKHSAGYDFFAVENFEIKPGEKKKITTGVKAAMLEDEVLMIFVRSSTGIKKNIRMCNQVGIVDSDYYGNPETEGHIYIFLENRSSDTYTVEKGEAFVQGIFTKFLLTDNDTTDSIRQGGTGSTNK